jgi:hypothetical protein
MQRLTWTLWESSSSTFGIPIFHPALQTACLLLPLPTLRPAASGRVNLVWPSETASCNFCLKIKAKFTTVADLRSWPLLMLTAIPIPLLTHSPPSSQSLFNKLQGENKPIVAFRSRFNGLILEMACCEVVIPPLLPVMLFLRSLHSCYLDIVEQFRTQHKSLQTMSIEMIVADVTYHDEFILKEPCRQQEKSSKTPSWIPAASAAHTDNSGTVWSSPFDWPSKDYGGKGIHTHWKKALVGSGICPICH